MCEAVSHAGAMGKNGGTLVTVKCELDMLEEALKSWEKADHAVNGMLREVCADRLEVA